MKFFIKLFTVKQGWYIVYIERLRVILSKIVVFLSEKIDFVLFYSADPGGMSHHAVSYLSKSSLFAKVPI